MADNDLVPRIIQFMQTQSNQSCSTTDILRKLRVPKKQINFELYRLQRQGLTIQIQKQPPVWQLQNDARVSWNVKPSNHTLRQINQSQHRGGKRFSRFNRGINTRGPKPGSHGNRFRQPNFPLMERIMVYLDSQTRPVKSIDIAKFTGFQTSSEINPSLYCLKNQGKITQVSVKPVMWACVRIQESDGYGTGPVITLSNFQNNTMMFQGGFDPSGAGFPADVEMDDEDSISSFNIQEQDNLSVKSEGGVPFTGGFGSFRQEAPTEDTGQSSGSGVNATPQMVQVDQNFVAIKQENILNSSDELQENINQNITVNFEPFPENFVAIKQENMSNSDDELRENINQNITVKSEPIPNEESHGCVNGQLSSTTSTKSSTPDTELNSVDHALSTLLDIRMQMAKPFIIAKKMEIEESDVDPILQECKRLKYVSFQNNVCVLTKKGEEYIKQKLNRPNEMKSSTKVTPRATVPSGRVQHAGMPLSPFELVNQKNGTFAQPLPVTTLHGEQHSLPVNTSDSQDIRLPFTGGPKSLPMAPQGHIKSEGSSITTVRPTVSTSSGPVPLMQIDFKSSPINRLMKLSQTTFKSLPSQNSFAIGSRNVSTTGQTNSYQSLATQNTGTSLSYSRNTDSLPMSEAFSGQDNKSVGLGGTESHSNNSSGFKPPIPPLDLVRKQLKKTEISPVRGIHTSSSSGNLSNINPIYSTQNPTNQLRFAIDNPTTTSTSQGRPLLSLSHDQPHSLPAMGSRIPMAPSGPTSLDLSTESFAAVNKNPVSALMEYAQSRHKVARIEVISQSGPSHRPRFVMGAFVGDQQYSKVTCTNKKDGRKEAADMALRSLIASGQYNTEKPSTALVPTSQMTHFDKVAALTHQQFNALVAGISENFAGRKVIAGLVMKTTDADVGTVIALGTGNRCITGQQMSLEGNTVNDSHAEIITRRGFIRFLYKKLLYSEPNTPNSLFETAPSGKLRVRPGISFHLYISTAPCGDGALFSPRDTASNNTPLQTLNDRTHHPTFTSNVQGLLRTKMEGGEGTIPIEPEFTGQTFDGIQRGERLRTMSCTDKICRWNVVGMQGALLSHFVEPIYLDSLTLGFLFDPGHLARAVCCRVNKGDTEINSLLPQGYHLNHPWLGRVTAVEPSRETQKTKSLSINWCYGDERAEVTDGTQGLCYTSIEKGFFSRCTKKNLYDSFKQCCEKFGRSDLLNVPSYNKAKMAATDFVLAKQAMVKKFAENKYGPWVSKPVEEEMFS